MQKDCNANYATRGELNVLPMDCYANYATSRGLNGLVLLEAGGTFMPFNILPSMTSSLARAATTRLVLHSAML